MDLKETPEALLDAKAVARWLGLAVPTVYEQAARGVLPAVRLWKGRRRTLIRFRRADIEEFIRLRVRLSAASNQGAKDAKQAKAAVAAAPPVQTTSAVTKDI